MLRSALIKKIMWALMPNVGTYAQFSFLAIWAPQLGILADLCAEVARHSSP